MVDDPEVADEVEMADDTEIVGDAELVELILKLETVVDNEDEPLIIVDDDEAVIRPEIDIEVEVVVFLWAIKAAPSIPSEK
jgi:hypothetical protein